MSGVRSSYLMTLSDEALADEIAGCRAGVKEFEGWVNGLSPSDRQGSEDGKKLAYYRERLRQHEEELARRKRQRPPSAASSGSASSSSSAAGPVRSAVPGSASVAGSSSSSAAASAGSARPKPIGLDADAAGPPIIIKDASGKVRTWRPGDGRIHRKRS